MHPLNPFEVIPEDLVIPSADDLLYEIGLCLTSVRERPKRRAIDNPIVIAILLNLYLIQRIAAIIIDESNHKMMLFVGDFGRYLGIKYQWNLLLILLGLIA